MPKTLNNVQTTDQYNSQNAQSIQNVYGSKGGWITNTAQIFAETQYSIDDSTGLQGKEDWSEEFVLPAGAHYLEPGTLGIRVRSFTAGTPVTVSAAIFRPYEPAMVLGGTGISTAPVINFLHNNALVAAESSLDFEDSTALVWTVTDTPGTKVAVTAAFSPNPSAVGAPTGATIISSLGEFVASNSGASNVFFVTVPGDVSDWRFTISNIGALQWGPGSAARDILLSRSAAGQLTIKAVTAVTTTLFIGNGTQRGNIGDAGGGIALGAATTDKVGFYGSSGVAQQTSAGNTSYADSGTIVVHTAGTFTGGTGLTAYTIGDIVHALKAIGLIAA